MPKWGVDCEVGSKYFHYQLDKTDVQQNNGP